MVVLCCGVKTNSFGINVFIFWDCCYGMPCPRRHRVNHDFPDLRMGMMNSKGYGKGGCGRFPFPADCADGRRKNIFENIGGICGRFPFPADCAEGRRKNIFENIGGICGRFPFPADCAN